MVLEPVTPTQLREKLREGIIQFAFRKKDGNLRLAIGTTNLELVPLSDYPKGTGKVTHNSVRFFDTQKRMWRSVSAAQPIYLA